MCGWMFTSTIAIRVDHQNSKGKIGYEITCFAAPNIVREAFYNNDKPFYQNTNNSCSIGLIWNVFCGEYDNLTLGL